MAMRPQNGESNSRPMMRGLLALVATLLTLAALQLGRPVMLPLVTGLMIAALAWPVFQWLQQKIPRALALLVTILAVVAVLLTILGAIGWSAVAVASDLRKRSDRIASLHQQASAVAERFGLDLPPLGSGGEKPDSSAAGAKRSTGEHTAAPVTAGEGGGSRLANRVGVGIYTMLGYLGLAVGFAALILAELRDARHRIRLRFEAAQADRIIGITSEVADSIRRYFKIKSITSGIAGVTTGLLALLFGIKFVAVWALLAFLFEYVPTIGSILAVVPPVAYAFIQFDGVAKPFAALGVFMVVQLFLGNYIDPRLEGRLLSISPLVVLLAIVFWAWMWGAPGSLLGIPIVVAVTVVTRHFASTRWVWAILTEPDEKEAEDAPRHS